MDWKRLDDLLNEGLHKFWSGEDFPDSYYCSWCYEEAQYPSDEIKHKDDCLGIQLKNYIEENHLVELSERTLEMMDKSMENFKKGVVSEPINFDED